MILSISTAGYENDGIFDELMKRSTAFLKGGSKERRLLDVYKRQPYKECPLCGAHLDSGEKCECREEEIEAKNSQKYACGLTEQDVESGWECPLDNPNETVERCEDCAFAKETD